MSTFRRGDISILSLHQDVAEDILWKAVMIFVDITSMFIN